MYELSYDARPGQGPHQPELIPTTEDAALAAGIAARLVDVRAEKATKLAELAQAAATAEREEHFVGTGERVAHLVVGAARDIARLEREERYLLAAYAGLTGATLLSDLDRIRDLEP